MNVPDNYDKFLEHEREQEKLLEKLPQCEECGEHIQDDYYFEINDTVICWECLKANYRKRTEDFCSE